MLFYFVFYVSYGGIWIVSEIECGVEMCGIGCGEVIWIVVDMLLIMFNVLLIGQWFGYVDLLGFDLFELFVFLCLVQFVVLMLKGIVCVIGVDMLIDDVGIVLFLLQVVEVLLVLIMVIDWFECEGVWIVVQLFYWICWFWVFLVVEWLVKFVESECWLFIRLFEWEEYVLCFVLCIVMIELSDVEVWFVDLIGYGVEEWLGQCVYVVVVIVVFVLCSVCDILNMVLVEVGIGIGKMLGYFLFVLLWVECVGGVVWILIYIKML